MKKQTQKSFNTPSKKKDYTGKNLKNRGECAPEDNTQGIYLAFD